MLSSGLENRLLAIFKKEARSKPESTIIPLIKPWFACIVTTVPRWVSNLVKKHKSRTRKSSQNNQDNQRHGMASAKGSTGKLYRLKAKQLRVDWTEMHEIRKGMEIVCR